MKTLDPPAPAGTKHGIAFLRAGADGPPLVLLHGFGSDRSSWRLNQGELARVASTVALDLPGHGQSDVDIGAGSVEALSRPVERFLDVEVGRAHLVGHSLGGAVAIDLLHRRPDLVASLLLASPAGLGRDIDTGFLSGFTGMASVEDAEAVLKRLVARPRLVGRQMASAVLEQIERPGARDGLRRIAERLNAIRPALAEAVATAGASPIPKLVLWGAADLTNPIDETYLRTLRAETAIIEEAGHLPHMENPAKVNQLMLRFLEGASVARQTG